MKMEAFVDNFIMAIGLDSQYTVLVINPTWSPDEPVYGYRKGVSQAEIDFLSTAGIEQLRKVMVGEGGGRVRGRRTMVGGWGTGGS